MFDKLVWTVMSYGVEIWGWEEWDEMERMQERYLRWILGVDSRTPGYLVREELQREKMKSRAGKRALMFEKRLEEGRGNELGRRCKEEIERNLEKRKELSDWEKGRKKFLEEKGIENIRREGRGGEGGIWTRELERMDKEKQREERWEKIRESKYNRWYGKVKGEGIPKYLKNGWGESRWRRVARFRLGNEMKEGRYWEEMEKRRCRLCKGEMETWEHVWERCREWREGGGCWQEAVYRILGEEGTGEKWMREIEEERRKENGREGEEGGE